uniref:Putative secreted protein n=1 Tax=Amblyomma cajennense TaxID=34607 RepID=A0A023FBW6_AMBCJ
MPLKYPFNFFFLRLYSITALEADMRFLKAILAEVDPFDGIMGVTSLLTEQLQGQRKEIRLAKLQRSSLRISPSMCRCFRITRRRLYYIAAAVAQWLWCSAADPKDAGSIPAAAAGISLEEKF